MRVAKSIVFLLTLLLSLLTGEGGVTLLVFLAFGMVVGGGAVFGPLSSLFAKPHEREFVISIWRGNEGWLHLPWLLAPIGWLPHVALTGTEFRSLVGFALVVICFAGPMLLYVHWLTRMAADCRRASVGTVNSRLVAGVGGLVLSGMATVLGLGVFVLGMSLFGRIG